MTVPTRVSPWRQREKTYEGVSSDKRYKAKTMCRGPFFDARAVLFRCTMGAKKKKSQMGMITTASVCARTKNRLLVSRYIHRLLPSRGVNYLFPFGHGFVGRGATSPES